jgi:GNAT superfamily N-acetyltransferase
MMKNICMWIVHLRQLTCLEITYIYVKPSHRRSGVASKLLDVFKDRCRAEGLPLCTQSEPAAFQFFLNQGFKDDGHCDFDLAQWADPNSGFGVFRLSGVKWVPEEI